MVIINSSPLIHLTRLGKIDYLIDQVKEILIPKAVYNEVVISGKNKNYAESYIIENYINDGKIIVKYLGDFQEKFYPPLGNGERESLELAKQQNRLLIIDDRKARNLAHLLKIEHQTTLATIFELLLSETIDKLEYKSNIKRIAENSWISADILQEYIEKGEGYGRQNLNRDSR